VSTVAIVLIAVGALMLLLFAGGFVASRRRVTDPALEEKIAAADRALEHARASDRGWERPNLERAALDALASHQPGGQWDEVALVLVDDRPGVEDDRCHLVATGPAGEARVILARRPGGDWFAEQIT
jgi:hypothetical protein